MNVAHRAALAAALSLAAVLPLRAAAPEPLAAHRAVYELSLLSGSGTKAPISARGRIAYDFSGSACEGYATTFRQLTELTPAEGETRTSDMRSTSFEEPAGKGLRFRIRTFVGGAPGDDVDGRAERSGDGALAVALTRPREAKFDLDRGIVFPTEHLQRVIAAAEAGQRTLETKVYDGSDTGEKVYDTLTVIGPARTGAATEAQLGEGGMAAMARWPVAISYFEEANRDGAPSYVLSFDLYPNGVSRALRLDYGDFTLAGELSKLELLAPSAACPR